MRQEPAGARPRLDPVLLEGISGPEATHGGGGPEFPSLFCAAVAHDGLDKAMNREGLAFDIEKGEAASGSDGIMEHYGVDSGEKIERNVFGREKGADVEELGGVGGDHLQLL